MVGTTGKRNKIPLFDEDWLKLKTIAKYYKEKEGINVSSGQIASALIHVEVVKLAEHLKKIRLKNRSVRIKRGE